MSHRNTSGTVDGVRDCFVWVRVWSRGAWSYRLPDLVVLSLPDLTHGKESRVKVSPPSGPRKTCLRAYRRISRFKGGGCHNFVGVTNGISDPVPRPGLFVLGWDGVVWLR